MAKVSPDRIMDALETLAANPDADWGSRSGSGHITHSEFDGGMIIGSDQGGIEMTNFQQEEDLREYTVLKNGEDQFSIWLADKEVPAGWEAVGQKGSKAACLEYIEQTWTDMTPRSVRDARAVKSDI